ncbi:protein phosphatase 2C domain-containing protein [Streptomyces olindensis]|uniref:protein phosphatase 2C domain-containing protein n=1 Tax=Streptomyces olindensis TaxID=358823 RepID=UPI0034112F2A
MSQQGGRPTGHEDDWWGQLYDDSTGDTGPAPAPDSLDDRFASAAGTVGDQGVSAASDERPGPGTDTVTDRPYRGDADPVVPAPRSGADDARDAPATRRPTDPVADQATERAPDRALDRDPWRAPWEPPPARPTGPVTFPTPTKPPDRAERPPEPPPTSGTAPPPPAPSRPPRPRTPPPPPPALPPSWPRREGSAVEEPPEKAAPPTDVTRPQPGTGASPVAAGPPPAAPPTTSPPSTPPPPLTTPSAPTAPPATTPPSDHPGPRIEPPATGPRPRGYVGSRPPTYDAEPTALPSADPDDLDDLVADTVLDGARYGACTLRAVSLRGDSARYRGEPRRDSLLTARFGTGEQALLLVAMATGARATPGAHRAAAEACHWIGRAVGRSHPRLVEDIRAGRRGDLKSGLHRLTDRSLGKLRASAAEQGIDPEEYAAGLRCLLLPADPECRTRVFFGVGPGGLFRLREGEWQDIEPQVTDVKGEPVLGFGSPPSETSEGDRLTMDLGIPTPPSPYEPAPEPPREPFRFRTSVARPGDTLLMCSSGLADPLRGEPELCEYLADRWSRPEPPGLAAFLADSQVRVKGYADDRTAAAVWEA